MLEDSNNKHPSVNETELEATNESKSTITNIETQPIPGDVILSHKNAILVNNIFTWNFPV